MSNTPPPDQPSNGEVKPEKAAKITLKVQFGNDSEPLILRVKSTTTFQKIYNAVASARGVELNSFRLQHEGRRLIPNETTPADLNLDDEEVLDYQVQQLGGSGTNTGNETHLSKQSQPLMTNQKVQGARSTRHFLTISMSEKTRGAE